MKKYIYLLFILINLKCFGLSVDTLYSIKGKVLIIDSPQDTNILNDSSTIKRILVLIELRTNEQIKKDRIVLNYLSSDKLNELKEGNTYIFNIVKYDSKIILRNYKSMMLNYILTYSEYEIISVLH